MAVICLGGGLFNAGERVHNLFLEKYFLELRHIVILPQRRALRFFSVDHFDVAGIVEDCKEMCTDKNIVYVGNADGADADSGTCVEYGMAIIATGRAIMYRTDFRTAEEKEVGVNAMLKAKGTIFIYHPCFVTETSEIEPYYRSLAPRIHKAIQSFNID